MKKPAKKMPFEKSMPDMKADASMMKKMAKKGAKKK